jgi:hypothetical protein
MNYWRALRLYSLLALGLVVALAVVCQLFDCGDTPAPPPHYLPPTGVTP